MAKRNIIKIDESLCNGCGSCAIACQEGAIQIKDGKARVVRDSFCDGLGACIGECPEGALTIETREADEFDAEAVRSHQERAKSKGESRTKKGDLPGEIIEDKAAVKEAELEPSSPCNISLHRTQKAQAGGNTGLGRHTRQLGPGSQLSSWPIQMRLAHADAPYFQNARLLIAADCSAFACPSIGEFIQDRVVLIGCPKLDESRPFVEKLTEILRLNEIKGITIMRMEVPCCSYLNRLVGEAVKGSGKDIALDQFICMIDGEVVEAKGESQDQKQQK